MGGWLPDGVSNFASCKVTIPSLKSALWRYKDMEVDVRFRLLGIFSGMPLHVLRRWKC